MKIEYTSIAKKELKKLDRQIQIKIKNYLDEIANLENPRSHGKALVGNLSHLWRYIVADYRLICDIQDEKILVTILRIGHRKEIYKS